MEQQLQTIREKALAQLAEAQDTAALEQLRVSVLGKKGELTGILRGMGKLPAAVPGSVYADLLAAGKLEDPFWRDNEDKALALMENDFLYTASFVPQAGVLDCPHQVLRFEGVDTTTGSTWYEAGRQWSMENGISDGTNMDGAITREQLAAMLYRYAKLMELDTSATADLSKFQDAAQVSDYATEAMQWANASGIITGRTGKLLAPQDGATRAETAAMLMRFCQMLE